MMLSSINLACIVAMGIIIKMLGVNGQGGPCDATYNGTEGEITTPGYPFHLGFQRSCKPAIDVGSGSIELTFVNVSLPDGAFIIYDLKILNVGVHDVQSKVIFIAKKKVEVDFRLPQNFNGTYGGVRMLYRRISKDVCKSNYQAYESEEVIRSPGYPDNIGANSSCEYYIDIGSFSPDDVIQIRFRELSFGPNDTLTVYDAMTNAIIFGPLVGPQRIIRANTTKSISVKIVLLTKFVPSIKQRYIFLYRGVPRDSCVLDYTGDYGGEFSSLDHPCVYNIRLKSSIQLDIKFNGLYVPNGGFIKVMQGAEYLQDAPLLALDSDDTGKTKYFRNALSYDVITISASAHAQFNATFKRFKKDPTITLRNPNGTILSPYYPHTYHFKAFTYSTYTYHIEIPKGRVRLNFTKISLYVQSRYLSDDLTVYDGKSSSAFRIWSFRIYERYRLPLSLLSSGNHLTVVFRPLGSPNWRSIKHHVFQFEAIYSSEIQVKNCIAFEWPNSRAERNVTLPGRKTKFVCNKNYVSGSYFDDVTRKCGFFGEWEEGRTLKCSRVCPRLDERLKENSSLSWWYSTSRLIAVHDGTYAMFSCNYYKDELIGPKTITCTSHGNYTALPPICKRKPKRNSEYSSSGIDGWKYGAGIGGAVFIISIVITVLRVCFGCFTCWSQGSNANSIPMSEVKYSQA